MKYFLYIDGACRGNPGIGGVGVYITDAKGNAFHHARKHLGHCTNNIAEYEALLLGLKICHKEGVRNISIRSDSELLVRQIGGFYKVKQPHLRLLYSQALTQLQNFDFDIKHIDRKYNEIADALANEAIDLELKKKK